MHSKPRGARRRVPRERRLPVDIAIVARRVPSFPVLRRMQLDSVETWRSELKLAGIRVGWSAILAHCYGQVCREIPELRDVYVARPWPYLYRHPDPIASLTMHRPISPDNPHRGRLVWGRYLCSEISTVLELQKQIDQWSTQPIEQVYPDGLRLERWPAPIRRLQWYLLMRWTGRKRAKNLGTFSISSLGHLGALNGYHPLVTTSSLAMGPISSNQLTDVVLLCDHRVIDGALGAFALQSLEEKLLEIPNVGLSPQATSLDTKLQDK